MNIVMVRDDCTDTRTLGTMTFEPTNDDDAGYVCQTLEDPVRPLGVKIAHETAIPNGTYGVTITMSARFGRLMPLLIDVPMFSGIRIHGGNTVANTSGCILVATSRGQHDDIVDSRTALAQVQKRIAEALADAQGVCTIEILQPKVTTTETFLRSVDA